MGNTLIAYQKWEDMAEYILKCVVNQLPKSERYAMGEQIRRLTVSIGVHIARAVAIRHVGMRKKEVEEADCDLCALKGARHCNSFFDRGGLIWTRDKG